MKSFFLLLLFISFCVTSWSQESFEQWEKESRTNKRLLPRYGHLPKSETEIKNDSSYTKQIMSLPQFKSRREASDHMIGLGFEYYYREDLRTAMYRFNQAYLLDSTNSDIYWGYGAVYMAWGQYRLAKEQYDLGLLADPANTHLLTDLGTYYMHHYYLTVQMPKNDIVKDPVAQAGEYMDSAIHYLNKSYQLDPKDVNTVYKLSICYWTKHECTNAWKYYDEAMALGGRPVTKEYKKDLKDRCKKD